MARNTLSSARFYSTYEELKLEGLQNLTTGFTGFYSTYEELKHPVAWAPFHTGGRFYSTYEELKRELESYSWKEDK